MGTRNLTAKIGPEELKLLKELYKETPAGKTFRFQGQDVLKEYAKYLIEFVEDKIGKGD